MRRIRLELKALTGTLPANTLYQPCPSCHDYGLTNDNIYCTLCKAVVPECGRCKALFLLKEASKENVLGKPLCEKCS